MRRYSTQNISVCGKIQQKNPGFFRGSATRKRVHVLRVEKRQED